MVEGIAQPRCVGPQVGQVGRSQRHVESAHGRVELDQPLAALNLRPLGGSDGGRRNVHPHVAQHTGLAGQPEPLGHNVSLGLGGRRDLTGDDAHTTSPTGARAATDPIQPHASLAGGLQ